MFSVLFITNRHRPGRLLLQTPHVRVSCAWAMSDVENESLSEVDAILLDSAYANPERVLALDGLRQAVAFVHNSSLNTIAWRGSAIAQTEGQVGDWEEGVWAAIQDCVDRTRGSIGHDSASAAWRRLIVGESRAIVEVTRIIRMVAKRRATVLITGETGTGKECAAKAIHLASDRASRPMISVNCASLPESLLEAELFGHTKGAFTGANMARAGHFEQAQGSTLFFDEIGDISGGTQVKLLRVLQEREIIRIGSSEAIPVDIRLVCATNRNLTEAVRNKTLREDLYYRLNVLPLRIPPLRERLSDIPLLVDHFVERICRREELPAKTVAPEVLERLASHQWPGNVRELENAVELAVAMSGSRKNLAQADFPLEGIERFGNAPIELPAGGFDFDEFMTQLQRTLIDQAMLKARGNQTVAAGLLGMKRTTLISRHKALSSCA